MRIQLLSKPGCHLCEDAEKVVQTVCGRLALPWEQINIEQDADLYERYKHEIPVLLLDGKRTFKYHIEEKALCTALFRRGRAMRER
ncbi:MAG: glutaredoxin family protein [Acidobacteriia bacterium]|nr:glutaredoxin family protein [Terriglobia bacterium]